ncbi:MAG TPA: GNAT family N-acetyltransferase [Falsiroseomonas sp.]|jgi:RimJ/RimL family protein N-acetyltransferase|nr:GNAT family N-acetyltransferase [Falsiroseomonas sp.]
MRDGPRLHTARLLLRPHGIEDFDDLTRLWGDPAVTRWIGGRPSTPEESWSRLLRYFGLWPALGFGYLAVVDRGSGAFLGDVGLADFHRDIAPSMHGMAEAGWTLGPAALGRGLATEALTALLEWYGAREDARAVGCIVAPENAASLRVARKCGFVDWVETTYRGTPTLLLRRS